MLECGDLGSNAAPVIVLDKFALIRDGLVKVGRRLLPSNGDPSAISVPFEAARHAILRCQGGEYQLPADKYDPWRKVVLVFDPAGEQHDGLHTK